MTETKMDFYIKMKSNDIADAFQAYLGLTTWKEPFTWNRDKRYFVLKQLVQSQWMIIISIFRPVMDEIDPVEGG